MTPLRLNLSMQSTISSALSQVPSIESPKHKCTQGQLDQRIGWSAAIVGSGTICAAAGCRPKLPVPRLRRMGACPKNWPAIGTSKIRRV